MSRIDDIKQYALERDEAERIRQEKIQQRKQGYIDQIKAFGPRIKELIEVANACLENGVEINRQGKSHSQYSDEWNNATFCTNCITHKVGFVWQYKYNNFINKIETMGIDGGGANGEYYLRTNGDYLISRVGRGYEDKCNELDEYQLETFVKTFDEFETAFYKYVDSLLPSIKKDAAQEEEQSGMTMM